MLHDKDRLSGKGGFVVAHNLKGNRIDGWVNQLKAIEAGRTRKRKDSVTMYHEILSWSDLDTPSMTPEKMERMTREYVKKRGVNGAILAVPHFNKNHYHVHLLVSGVDRSGKAMRLSREELADLKRQIQSFQVEQFPELHNSLPAHGRKSKLCATEKEMQYKKRTGKQTMREKVAEIVTSCLKRSKSDEEFFALLLEQDMETYVRGRRVYGVVCEGRKFRFGTLGIDLHDQISKDRKLLWRVRHR